jgi:glycosyltransferase involved in cell wall biosynthesis
MKLSILMPVYNEVNTVPTVIKRVLDVEYPCDVELVIVDDGSRDGTAERLAQLDDARITVHAHPRNRGKGAAVRTAAGLASGTHMVICDADLEYAPEDLPALLKPVLAGEAAVVYGTRTFGSHTAYSFWYVLGNKAVTLFANALFDSWISDLETCFKLMPLPTYRELDVRSAGFGMEAEITGKLLRQGVRPYEVPISYRARSREEGKKLTWRDGVQALWILLAIRLGWRK